MRGEQHSYSVLLPTYNERENIGIIVALLVKTLEAECAPAAALALLFKLPSRQPAADH